MDITEALTIVSTLSADRKQQLITAYEAGTLTEEGVEELKEHLLKAVERLAVERAIAEDLVTQM